MTGLVITTAAVIVVAGILLAALYRPTRQDHTVADSTLITFRDHCRRMATATPTTPVRVDGQLVSSTPAEQLLWTRLADEIDHWLEYGLEDNDDHTEPLWDEAL